jgi:hypothetical protein
MMAVGFVAIESILCMCFKIVVVPWMYHCFVAGPDSYETTPRCPFVAIVAQGSSTRLHFVRDHGLECVD